MMIKEYMNYVKKFKIKYNFGIGEDDSKVPLSYFKHLLYQILFRRKIKYNDFEFENKVIIKLKDYEYKNFSSLEKENLIFVNGSTEGIFLSIYALKDNIKKGMLFYPFYPLYKEILTSFNISFKKVNLEKNKFNLTYRQFINNLEEDINLVILNTPNNPTGISYKNNELIKIINYCKKRNIYLIIDQVYCDFNYHENKNCLPILDNTFYIKSFSKSFNMTGLRLGYIISHSKNIDKLNKLQNMIKVNTSLIQKYIAYSILKKPHFKYVLNKKYLKNKTLIDNVFKKNHIDYISMQGTFYCYINIKKYKLSSYDFAILLVKEKGIILLPSSLFNGEGYLRLSYACSYSRLKKGLKIICSYFNDLENKRKVF